MQITYLFTSIAVFLLKWLLLCDRCSLTRVWRICRLTLSEISLSVTVCLWPRRRCCSTPWSGGVTGSASGVSCSSPLRTDAPSSVTNYSSRHGSSSCRRTSSSQDPCRAGSWTSRRPPPWWLTSSTHRPDPPRQTFRPTSSRGWGLRAGNRSVRRSTWARLSAKRTRRSPAKRAKVQRNRGNRRRSVKPTWSLRTKSARNLAFWRICFVFCLAYLIEPTFGLIKLH